MGVRLCGYLAFLALGAALVTCAAAALIVFVLYFPLFNLFAGLPALYAFITSAIPNFIFALFVLVRAEGTQGRFFPAQKSKVCFWGCCYGLAVYVLSWCVLAVFKFQDGGGFFVFGAFSNINWPAFGLFFLLPVPAAMLSGMMAFGLLKVMWASGRQKRTPVTYVFPDRNDAAGT